MSSIKAADLHSALQPVAYRLDTIAEALKQHQPSDQGAAAIALLRELVDDEPCRLDHNAFCQTHYYDHPCANERARTLLAQLDANEN